jgi:hypothetical protein
MISIVLPNMFRSIAIRFRMLVIPTKEGSVALYYTHFLAFVIPTKEGSVVLNAAFATFAAGIIEYL